MSSRTAVRSLGLTLLFAGVLLGLLPVLSSYTSVLNAWPDMAWHIADFQILSINKLPSGDASATVSTAVWIAAALGELLFVLGWLMPDTRSQYVNLRN